MSARGLRADPASWRVIDLAIGILMGLRGCSEQDAFDDLVGAVHNSGIGPGALARALVSQVGGSGAPFPHRSDMMHRWGHLIADRVSARNDTADCTG